MPLDGNYRISSPFGMRIHPILHYRRMHTGVDLAIRHGYPIKAPANGKIEFLGHKGGYGKYIVINHKNGYKTGYGHLSGFSQNIKYGSNVSSGMLIGYVGNTGTSSGPHLHYEIIKNGQFVNPLTNNPSIPEKLSREDLKRFKKQIEKINNALKSAINSHTYNDNKNIVTV